MEKHDLLNKRLNSALEVATMAAEVQGYDLGKITITPKPINGSKVGYAGGSKKGSGTVSGYIVIDNRSTGRHNCRSVYKMNSEDYMVEYFEQFDEALEAAGLKVTDYSDWTDGEPRKEPDE